MANVYDDHEIASTTTPDDTWVITAEENIDQQSMSPQCDGNDGTINEHNDVMNDDTDNTDNTDNPTICEGTDGHNGVYVVMDEIVDRDVVGKYTGQVKWFNDRLGYGFCTICDGDEYGKDIFVHHTGIRPVNSNYKTLHKGEYVNFNLTNGHNGPQAVDVTGICGGSLMCDITPIRRIPMQTSAPAIPIMHPSFATPFILRQMMYPQLQAQLQAQPQMPLQPQMRIRAPRKLSF
jgi:CspA family cold shock protein